MYLRAGVISLGLLLLSRVLGLLRESVQAWGFGTSALADVVVVMLTLPDLASSILAGGALSYALLPWWARQGPEALAASQRQTSKIFLGIGAALALWILLVPAMLGGWLAPGVGADTRPEMLAAMRWAALAVPASLLTFVWYTRLQYERDVVGMYGMNVVHTGVVIIAMLAAASVHAVPSAVVVWLGGGLLLAFAWRLVFLHWRLRRVVSVRAEPVEAPASPSTGSGRTDAVVDNGPVTGLPPWTIWLWAMLATGAPAALPLLARSLVSGSGEGAIATFNYAWKLVELPNQLAIQVVAALAFPAFTRAYAQGREFTVQLRSAFLLAWTLACAAALALWLGAQPLAQLLFGWGRMGPQQVAEVAHWAALGAWTLLPQALIAVLVLVLATLQRLPAAAVAYTLAVAALALCGIHEGPRMMLALAGVLAGVVLILLWSAREQVLRALAWRELAAPALLCAVLACGRGAIAGLHPVAVLALAGLAAAVLMAASYACSPVLRAALKR